MKFPGLEKIAKLRKYQQKCCVEDNWFEGAVTKESFTWGLGEPRKRIFKKIPPFILGLVWENTASIGVMTRIPARGAEIARKNPQENKKIEPSIENEANEANAYRPGGAEIARKNPSKNL